jgi:hypothetical protein
MTKNHDTKRAGRRPRVAEPVQVYLHSPERERLDRLVQRLDTTKSDVLRRALAALDRELSDPTTHPALRIIGIAADFPRLTPPDGRTAVAHDRFLADNEVASWPRRKRRRRGA